MKNVWIAIAVLSAILCGILGYKIANRKPVYQQLMAERPKVADLGDSIDEAQKVDPKVIIAKEEGRISTGFKELRGLAVGPEDRIYVTTASVIQVFDSKGAYLGSIKVARQPANCAFAGPGKRTLYITAREGPYKLAMLSQGPKRLGK